MRLTFIIFLLLTDQVYSQINLDEVPTMTNPFVDSITPNASNQSLLIDQEQWKKNDLNKIEEYNSRFDYSIIGRRKIGNLNLLLVERDFVEEEIHWLCLTDQDVKLIDWIQTAYNNSEGFLTKISRIDNEYILVTEQNDFSEVNVSNLKYEITENGFKLIK